jgi:hypothetical protein
MKNKIQIEWNICKIFIKDKICTIDTDDLHKFVRYSFNITSSGYVTFGTQNALHRCIIGAKKGEFVDHINRNKLDNRKSNLRIVTRKQNNQNLSLSKRNTSGTRGVCFVKKANKWRSKISINGKETHIGLYSTYEEAVDARKNAELEYYYNGV